MKFKKILITISIILILPSCSKTLQGDADLRPFSTYLSTGKYFTVSSLTSTSKTWISLATYVGEKITYFLKKYPELSSKPIYILPKNDTLFHRTYRELLSSSLIHNKFHIVENPGNYLIIKYNSQFVYNRYPELIIDTSLYNNSTLIFKDISVLYIKNKSLTNYLPMNFKDKYTKTFKIVGE